jgi:aryl-alcohol dehydrogenase-like predicted oxidoreductase
MKYRTLGRTGLIVSEIGYGTWALGNPAPSATDEQAVQAIVRAVELGCNFFDTADVYGLGRSEEILAAGLRKAGKLKDAIIATKGGTNFNKGDMVSNYTPEYIRNALDASLQRLGRDHIDLYQLHNPSRQIINDGIIFEALDELKAAGKIRFYGVSVHSVADGMACLKSGKPDTIQIVYNISTLLQSENPAEQLFPLCKELNVGLITREPLANGFLTGQQTPETRYEPGDIRASWPSHYRTNKLRLASSVKFLEKPGKRSLAQAAIRFVLDETAVSTCIVGIKTAEQAEQNLTVSEMSPLTPAEHEQIRKTLFG